MKQILLLCFIALTFVGCESTRVKENRKKYKEFLYEMSDRKDYLKIKSEQITIKGEYESEMTFLVEFETRYYDRVLNDKIEIYFIGNSLTRINGEYYLKYKTDFLLKVLGVGE
jgi:hypothetical protein